MELRSVLLDEIGDSQTLNNIIDLHGKRIVGRNEFGMENRMGLKRLFIRGVKSSVKNFTFFNELFELYFERIKVFRIVTVDAERDFFSFD